MKTSYIGISRDHLATKVGIGETHISNSYRRQQEKYPHVRFMSHPKQITSLYSQKMDTGSSCTVRLKNNGHPLIEQTKQLHLENICRNLERRLAVAKAKGDEELISLLHLESQQLTLCVQGR